MAHIHDLEVDEYLYDSVNTDPLKLDDEFVRLPADLAYWHGQAANALRAYQTAKIDTKRLEARLSIELREQQIHDGKKPTESTVAAAVETSDEMYEARKNLVGLEADYERIRGVVDAVRAKKDMVVSIGHQIRAELSDPIVRAAYADKRLSTLGK
jgi:hypothetical protein